MKNLSDNIRDLIARHSNPPETARTNRQIHSGEEVGGNSAICARDSGAGHIPDSASTDPEMASWSKDARYIYDERLGIALDQGWVTSPGSEAETIARRAHAGIPANFGQSRAPDIFDSALEAFLALGGLTFLRAEDRKAPMATSATLTEGGVG